jgi:hypothetical protein
VKIAVLRKGRASLELIQAAAHFHVRPAKEGIMRSKLKNTLVIQVIFFLILISNSRAGGSTVEYSLKRFYNQLYIIVTRYFPQASFYKLNHQIHFEFNTRIFLIHYTSHTGEWGNPVEERGPNKGGIYCDITLLPGKYSGERVAPQTSDLRYYKSYLMAPYSPKHGCHLKIWLKYPHDVPVRFLREFEKFVNDFGNYLS